MMSQNPQELIDFGLEGRSIGYCKHVVFFVIVLATNNCWTIVAVSLWSFQTAKAFEFQKTRLSCPKNQGSAVTLPACLPAYPTLAPTFEWQPLLLYVYINGSEEGHPSRVHYCTCTVFQSS
jgi:hypothetical protein